MKKNKDKPVPDHIYALVKKKYPASIMRLKATSPKIVKLVDWVGRHEPATIRDAGMFLGSDHTSALACLWRCEDLKLLRGEGEGYGRRFWRVSDDTVGGVAC